MLNLKKFVFVPLFFMTAVSAFSDILLPGQKEKVADGLNDFANEIMVAAPEAATQMNVWSEAHIGNLYPSIHPHFGGGISIGGTAINMSGFKAAAKEIADDYNSIASLGGLYPGENLNTADFEKIPEKFVLPSVSLDLRLGGFGLPFDIGIFAMMTNPNIFAVHLDDPSSISNMSQAIKFGFMGFNGSLDYFSIGGDFRIRLLEEDGLIPMISLGGGYAYTKGVVKVHTDAPPTEILGSTQETAIDMALGYRTQVIFLQGQISKDLSILNLFLGARGLLSNTTCDWSWAIDSTNSTAVPDYHFTDSDSGSVTATGLSDTHKDGKWDFSGIQPQLFGGLSINLPKTQLTLSLCADVRSFFDKGNYTDFIWSGAFGLHFKI